jgi:tripartite-type tricarboxylate transporter receptor subunit TctC
MQSIGARAKYLTVGMALLLASIAPVAAQDYPTRQIHIDMGFPAGAFLDIVTRHFAAGLQKVAGKPVIVENKVGAGNMIAMTATAKAAPDGYSLYFGPGASAAAVQFKTLPIDPIKDFIPIASVVAFPFVLIVNPAVTPVNSVTELVEHLKRKNDAKYASPNTLSLVGGALLSDTHGLNATSVPYRSAADGIRDLIAGDIDFIFNDAGFAYSMMKQGKVKGLAVTLQHRSTNAPELPTMTELGYKNFDFHGWMGAYAPAGVSPVILAKLEAWFLEIAKSDETAAFFKTIGADPFPLSGKEFAAWEVREFAAWRDRAKIASIKPE